MRRYWCLQPCNLFQSLKVLHWMLIVWKSNPSMRFIFHVVCEVCSQFLYMSNDVNRRMAEIFDVCIVPNHHKLSRWKHTHFHILSRWFAASTVLLQNSRNVCDIDLMPERMIHYCRSSWKLKFETPQWWMLDVPRKCNWQYTIRSSPLLRSE